MALKIEIDLVFSVSVFYIVAARATGTVTYTRLTVRILRGLPLNAFVNARACTSGRSTCGNLPNLTHNHKLHQGVAPPGLT